MAPTRIDPNAQAVLVVDDDPVVRAIVMRILRSYGHATIHAHDGSAAIALFDKNPGAIPLVLMDVNMPGEDGTRVAARLRERRPDLPIIYISGEGEGVRLDRGEEHLPKPFAPAQLASLVKRRLAAASQV